MRKEKVEDKNGNVYKTQQGEELQKTVIEKGDEIIPVYNTVLEKEKTAKTKDGEKKITDYLLKCKIKDVNTGEVYSDEFLNLTETQAKQMKKLIDNGTEINQHVFVVYTYTIDRGTFKGIGLKKNFKEPIDFE